MITRHDFLRYCEASAASIALSAGDLLELREALAHPATPVIIRLRGGNCTGCSVSPLTRISSPVPGNADDVLIASLNVDYHPTLLDLAGNAGREAIRKAYAEERYLLMVEGGIPADYGGSGIWAWSYDEKEPYVAFGEVVEDLSRRADAVICRGTCAAWGGIPFLSSIPAPPSLLKGVGEVTGRSTINIGGCPVREERIVWTIVQLLLGKTVSLDSFGRPAALYNKRTRELPARTEKETAANLLR
ncbi:MAG: hypothetical protein K8I29_06805 [Alphaproteobacteria bacterium]|uniref:NADH:ubiquinone oxidoreductase-like 20kDa subunit domain-containing protein n=1 Tax=Candidatus Nitrobium versatile TaxID=2884831 RepID=A0A953M109_9BACT|nr:hypothetical protein [Candidatus Nitrobium versatile]